MQAARSVVDVCELSVDVLAVDLVHRLDTGAVRRLAEEKLLQVADSGADCERWVSVGSRSDYAKIAFLIFA